MAPSTAPVAFHQSIRAYVHARSCQNENCTLCAMLSMRYGGVLQYGKPRQEFLARCQIVGSKPGVGLFRENSTSWLLPFLQWASLQQAWQS
jgi:hypothetical protein